jgi:hypothetical protein
VRELKLDVVSRDRLRQDVGVLASQLEGRRIGPDAVIPGVGVRAWIVPACVVDVAEDVGRDRIDDDTVDDCRSVILLGLANVEVQ